MNKFHIPIDKAIREFEADLEDDPYNWWLKNEIEELKETKEELENLQKAIGILQAITQLDKMEVEPDDGDGYFIACMSRLRKEEYDQLKKFFG